MNRVFYIIANCLAGVVLVMLLLDPTAGPDLRSARSGRGLRRHAVVPATMSRPKL
jgi:hypothetical protein